MGAAGSHPEDERKIENIVEKLRADGAEADFRSARFVGSVWSFYTRDISRRRL